MGEMVNEKKNYSLWECILGIEGWKVSDDYICN